MTKDELIQFIKDNCYTNKRDEGTRYEELEFIMQESDIVELVDGLYSILELGNEECEHNDSTKRK